MPEHNLNEFTKDTNPNYTKDDKHSSALQEDPYTKEKTYQPDYTVKDVNSHYIFRNNTLTCQLLRDYLHLKIFEGITPEDIEDVSERYREYLGVEFHADTVKSIKIQMNGHEKEIFVISLIEHKSYIDHDVAMQLLRYMCAIWYDYKLTQEKKHSGISHQKRFRYPLIVPIVYYEGKATWSAHMDLASRIEFPEEMAENIPDFKYRLLRTSEFSTPELEQHNDEMSLVMMINKVQSLQDYENFKKISKDYAGSIYQNAPAEIKHIFQEVLWALLMKMNVTTNEAQKLIEDVGGKGMGYLFENLTGIDVQAERENTRLAREEAAKAKREAENAKHEAENAKHEFKNAKDKLESIRKQINSITKAYVDVQMKAGESIESIRLTLANSFHLEESEIETLLNSILTK